MGTTAERVAAGAAFLDERDPDWWRADVDRAIDLEILDLAEPAHCVLGQRCPVAVLARFCYLDPGDEDGLSAEWWRAYTAYAMDLSGLGDAGIGPLAAWGDEHGFSNSAGKDAYPALTAEWKRVITGKRAMLASLRAAQ